jgi:hypothetical protein
MKRRGEERFPDGEERDSVRDVCVLVKSLCDPILDVLLRSFPELPQRVKIQLEQRLNCVV